MLVLVTGAAGRIGGAVCRVLAARGHAVRATDRRTSSWATPGLELVELLDAERVLALTRGCDAVVHLGNHPRESSEVPASTLLAENTAMNANVFRGAVAHGVTRLVFASSIQVMFASRSENQRIAPDLPYLPLDGEAPRHPNSNAYAQSKAAGEMLLEALAAEHAELACVSLRFPYVADGLWLRRFGNGNRVRRAELNLREALMFVVLEDAAELLATVSERAPAGYRQFLPAQALRIANLPLGALLEAEYREVLRKRPLEAISSLVDVSALERAFGWKPRERPAVTIV
jgi:nucleoside-diphosphate-sugar epimerase